MKMLTMYLFLRSPVVTICTNRFNIKKFYILATHCIYVFCMDLRKTTIYSLYNINPLNAELNPICHLLALLGGATIVVVSRLRVILIWSIPLCYKHTRNNPSKNTTTLS